MSNPEELNHNTEPNPVAESWKTLENVEFSQSKGYKSIEDLEINEAIINNPAARRDIESVLEKTKQQADLMPDAIFSEQARDEIIRGARCSREGKVCYGISDEDGITISVLTAEGNSGLSSLRPHGIMTTNYGINEATGRVESLTEYFNIPHDGFSKDAELDFTERCIFNSEGIMCESEFISPRLKNGSPVVEHTKKLRDDEFPFVALVSEENAPNDENKNGYYLIDGTYDPTILNLAWFKQGQEEKWDYLKFEDREAIKNYYEAHKDELDIKFNIK